MRRMRHLLAGCGLVAAMAAGPDTGAVAAQSAGTDGGVAEEVEAVRLATARYRELDNAIRDGYILSRIGRDFPLMGEHWVKRELLDRPPDLLRPAFLQYAVIDNRRVLVGVAYGRWQDHDEPPPEGFTGDDDVWHTHALSPELPTLAMLHAWVWSANPDGIFAGRNPALPYLRAGLPAAWAAPHDRAAPLAIGLLAPGVCDALPGRLEWVAPDDALPREAVRDACDVAGERVAAALRGGAAGDALNAVAAGIWLDFLAEVRAVLGPREADGLGGIWIQEAAVPDRPGHAH